MSPTFIQFILFIPYFAFATQPKWIVARHDKCVFTVSKNWMILFEEHPALFVNSLKKESYDDCRSACCSHLTCNGYFFDESNKDEGCKLIRCSRNGTDCKKALRQYDKDVPLEVGFITGLSGTTVNMKNAEPAHGDNTRNKAAVAIPNEIMTAESSHWENEAKINPTQSNLEVVVTPHPAIRDPTVKLISPSKEINYYTEHVVNFAVPQGEDIKEHTNSISLTIAFVFGLVFLVTVLYLTGKRFVEGIKDRQRSGYTRINYLLNGV